VAVLRPVLGSDVLSVAPGERLPRFQAGGLHIVPSGGVVPAGLPRVDDADERASIQLSLAREVVQPALECGKRPGEEGVTTGGVWSALGHTADRSDQHRWVRDAARQESWRVMTHGVRPAVGARKVAVEVTWVVTDVGKHPVDPLRIEQGLDLAHGPPPIDRSPAEAYQGAIPVPLVWVLVHRWLGPAACVVGTENSQCLGREVPRA